MTREHAATNTVQTEAQVSTLRQAVEKFLQRLWKDLHEDIHLSRVPR